LILIVNRRRVHNRALLAAIDESYRGLIPTSRHGYGVVSVDVAPETLDVNVHPAKREVRFSDERAVFSSVQRACWAALRAAPPLRAGEGTGFPFGTLHTGELQTLEFRDGTQGMALIGRPPPGRGGADLGADAVSPDTRSGPGLVDARIPASLSAMTALGQAGSGFLVATAGDAVVLIDPHAAHEKILYTDLQARWREPASPSPDAQLLLMPVVVECTPDRAARVAAEHDFFSRAGFALDQFGPGAVRCTAVPIAAAGADPERLVAELIDRLDEPDAGAEERRHRLAALVACHAAVRFGDKLDIAAQQRLLDQLAATPGGTTCPHGRPSVLVLDDPVLRRAFRRPQR
jgi:DNA mismatch repair protein MutL